MRVFKYEIPSVDEARVRLPMGAQVLSVGQQDEQLYLWALVNPAEKRIEQRVFRIAGTGHEIADVHQLKFIGTVHLNGHRIVLHVFERDEFRELDPNHSDEACHER